MSELRIGDNAGVTAYPLVAHLVDHNNAYCDACKTARVLLARLSGAEREEPS